MQNLRVENIASGGGLKLVPTLVQGRVFKSGALGADDQEYLQYLLSVFGSSQVVMGVDDAVVSLNKTLEELARRADLATPFLQIPAAAKAKHEKEKALIVVYFSSCWSILSSVLVHLSLFGQRLAQDAVRADSVWAPFWDGWRGARYSRKAHFVHNRIQQAITRCCATLSAWIITFISHHPELDVEEFYALHSILMATQNAAWAQRISRCGYAFGDVSVMASRWRGTALRRALFFRVMLRDKVLLDAVENFRILPQEDALRSFSSLKTIAAGLEAEILWMAQQHASLNSIWHRSTKRLFSQRLALYRAKLTEFGMQKMHWFCVYASKIAISSENFALLTRNLPTAALQAMHKVQAILRTQIYYSKNTETQLQQHAQALLKFVPQLDARVGVAALVKYYRDKAVYYTRKDICVFLASDNNWSAQSIEISKAKLDDMLNVSHAGIVDWEESYLEFYRDLLTDWLINGTDILAAAERISLLLRHRLDLFSAKGKQLLQSLDNFLFGIKKFPKTPESFLEHLMNLLQMPKEPARLFRLVNTYYQLALPLMIANQEKAVFLKQKKILAQVVFKHLQLMSEATRMPLCALPLVKFLAEVDPLLRDLIMQDPVIQDRSADGPSMRVNLTTVLPTGDVPRFIRGIQYEAQKFS